jgi:hypothetical protein
LNGCCAKEQNCKTKAEINTKQRRKKLGMTCRQRGMGTVGTLLLKGGPPNETRGVSQCALAKYINLKCERRVKETQIFHQCKNILFNKNPLPKRNQNPSRYYYYYNSIITNLSSFNTNQNIIFQKSSYKNRPIIT